MMTMTVQAERFPIVEAGDAEDVVLALETGRALWGQGDPREAVRWLRRAAEHAEESGNDIRALSLARMAADLTTLMQSPQTVPVPPRDDEVVEEPQTSSAPPRVSSLPSPPPRASKSRRPPAPSALAKSPSSPVAAAKPVSPTAPPVLLKPPTLNGSSPVNGRSSLPSARPSAPRASVAPLPPVPSRPSTPGRTTAESPVLQHSRTKRRGAVRVAVRGDGSALLVEILDEGQAAPAGAVEALLVPLDPNADLLSLD